MLTIPTLDGLDGVSHGYFTRQGGAGGGLYASLNCGFGSADAPEIVQRNRAYAMTRLGVAPEALTTVHQVHSADVVTVGQAWSHDRAPRADAMVTDRPGICLGILTADCIPILFADPRVGVIGATHSGWKGATGNIVAATVEAMTKLGARREDIRAGIGPAIRQHSYEVGPEFPGYFLGAERFFRPSLRTGHFLFDLPGYVMAQLAGLGLAAIEDIGLDTASDDARFFSYRRSTLRGEPDYGRMLSAIALAG